VQASATIPLLFPPTQVGDRYYVDGGLGQQTPLRPALRLGVDRVLVISLRKTLAVGEGEEVACCRAGEPPTWAQVLGKTMNSVLLDTAGHDVERLRRWNRMIDWGERQYGPDFPERLSGFLAEERGAAQRRVQPLLISPSVDLGEMAIDSVRRSRPSAAGLVTRLAVQALARTGSQSENDALSYLLFDRAYLAEVLALGERDAAERHDELVGLFADE
jgi:NTE family protein